MSISDFELARQLAERVLARPAADFFTAEVFAEVVIDLDDVVVFNLTDDAQGSPFGSIVGYIVVDAPSARSGDNDDLIEDGNRAFAVWIVPESDGVLYLSEVGTFPALVDAAEAEGYVVDV